MDPRFEQAGQYFGNMQNLGMGGMQALAGDPRATQNLMNPYEQQVMSAMDPMFAKARAGAMNTIGDQATRARAFGGSRQGVAQGVALGNIANQQAQTMANLRYQGFGDAMGRAGQLANLGMGAAQAGGQMGQYARIVALTSACRRCRPSPDSSRYRRAIRSGRVWVCSRRCTAPASSGNHTHG
jgi:hypothetical protein